MPRSLRRFSVRAPTPGKYRVKIFWNKKTGKKISGGDGPNLVDQTTQVLSPRFNVKTELTVDISTANNKALNFDLKQ